MADAGLDDILISYPAAGLDQGASPCRPGEACAEPGRDRQPTGTGDGGRVPHGKQASHRRARRVRFRGQADRRRLGRRGAGTGHHHTRHGGMRFDGLMTYPSTAATAEFVARQPSLASPLRASRSPLSRGRHAQGMAGARDRRPHRGPCRHLCLPRSRHGRRRSGDSGRLRAPCARDCYQPSHRHSGGDRCRLEEPVERPGRSVARCKATASFSSTPMR